MSVSRSFELAGQVPMLPDQTINWNVHAFPEAQGKLYAAPETSSAILEDTLSIATRDYRNTPHTKLLGYGTFGTVSRQGDTAFKTVHAYEGESFADLADHDRSVGLSAVRASVMVHAGLSRTTSANEPISYAAPNILACFVSEDVTGEASRTTWAMSYEKGGHPAWWHRGIPDSRTQQVRYNAAIEACGGDPDSVDLDMGRDNRNLLVSANMFGLVKRVVKLDVSAWWPYDW